MNELDDLTLIMQGKAGDTAAVNELWARHQNFIRQQMAKIYAKNKGLADRVGIDRDDLITEGWFSVRDAVRRYDPSKRMAFLTVLGWSIRATATKVLTTSRGKLLRDENGRQIRVPADPLNYALSSDLPLEDETDSTMQRYRRSRIFLPEIRRLSLTQWNRLATALQSNTPSLRSPSWPKHAAWAFC